MPWTRSPGWWVIVVLVAASCSRSEPADTEPTGQDAAGQARPAPSSLLEYDLLYLPDKPVAPARPAPSPGAWSGPGRIQSLCPEDMVEVRGRFCIDRYEAVLVDRAHGRRLSPYYPPEREATRRAFFFWQRKRSECPTTLGRTMPLIPPPEWQLTESFEPLALSVPGEVPNGYTSGLWAEKACRNAGKRLCKAEEWVTACRGEKDTQYPYGDQYLPGRCNVFRQAHPALVLHGNPSIGHTDPRLNTVEVEGEPLLRRTGATDGCRSQWGADAVFDMVGNLDEWVDDPEGLFLGGFYSRATRLGCDARVSAHPPSYFDYSTGVRCCLSLPR